MVYRKMNRINVDTILNLKQDILFIAKTVGEEIFFLDVPVFEVLGTRPIPVRGRYRKYYRQT